MLCAEARAGFVITVQTPDGACPEQLQVTLDGVPAWAVRKAGCDWWLKDDAEEAQLTVRAPGYLEETRRLDVEPHRAGMVTVRLTPSGELLPGGELPSAEPAAQGHGHSHGGEEAVAQNPGDSGTGSAGAISGTVSLRFRPGPVQADLRVPGGAFGRTTDNRRKTAGLEVNLRAALFRDRLFVRIGYRPVWWTDRALYEPPARSDITGYPVTERRTDMLADQLENAYGVELRWLPTPAHEFTASIDGISSDRDGLLHGAGDRLSPVLNPGLGVTADDFTPPDATRGSLFSRAQTTGLGYTFRHGGFELGAWVRDFNSRLSEHPAPGGDVPLYIDRRRDMVHAIQVLNGIKPVVPLEQVRYGGYGIFTDDVGAGRRTWGFRLAGRFGEGGRVTSELRAQSANATLRESLLRSGRRGDDGPLVYLDFNRVGPLRETFVRIRGGVTVETICAGQVNPLGASLADACPANTYVISRGEIGPPPADVQVRTDRIEWLSRWQGKRQSLSLTLEARRDKVVDPTDYTILGALTGTPLLNRSRYPVGTYDPDIPTDSAVNPSPPVLIAGPGRFIGGSYQFPVEPGWKLEWQKQIGRGDRLTASWARSPEDPPEPLLHHFFEARFSVAQAAFTYPDLSGGGTLGFAGGGALSRVAPGTRLGSHEDFRVAWQAGRWLPVGLTVELFQRRQHRILAQTQSNSMENVVNRALDSFFYSDANFGTRFCTNCPPGQASAFPDFVPGVTGTEPNPESRGLLATTLANPGDNTDPALFGHPKRISEGIRFSAVRAPAPGGRLTLRLSGQWSRSHGNYEGMQFAGDDQEHVGPRTIFSYPISHLTRGQYAMGPLPEEFPVLARLDLSWDRLGVEGLTAALTSEWREGTLRTPLLALPLSSLDGNIPGNSPDYYRMDMDFNGIVDRLVLRDYHPARRGSLGRNADQLRFDAALLYRKPRARLAWRAGLAVTNLFNRHPATVRDDRLEIPVALRRDVAPSAADSPLHLENAVEYTTRIPNPDFGRTFRESPPRTVQLLFAVDF